VKKLLMGLVVLLMASTGFVPHSTAALSLYQEAGTSDYTVKLFGFSQLDVRTRNQSTGNEGLYFAAQRIRLGASYFHENVVGFLLVDFNQPQDKKDAGLPKMIKDAFVGYRFSDAAFVRLGMIKTPSGMTFTTHSFNLDIAERNHLDKGLVLERDMGILVSGRQIGGGDSPRSMTVMTSASSILPAAVKRSSGTKTSRAMPWPMRADCISIAVGRFMSKLHTGSPNRRAVPPIRRRESPTRITRCSPRGSIPF